MSRPTWSEYFMEMAKLTSTRATCLRKKVGAVLVNSAGRVVATGYNGSPRGMPHCTDQGCTLVVIDGKESCVATLHAESNAIDYAGRHAQGCTLYVTCIPCFECSKRIVNAGIHTVVYDEYYKSQKTEWAEGLLRAAGVRLVCSRDT